MHGSLIFVGIGVAFLLAVLSLFRPSVSGYAVLVTYLASVSQATASHIDIRYLALPFLLTLGLGRRHPDSTAGQQRWTLRLLVPLLLLSLASITWTADEGKSLQATEALIALPVFVILGLRRLGQLGMVKIVFRTLGASLVFSLATLAVPSVGLAGGRFRGVYGNSNGLGLALVLFVFLAAHSLRGSRRLIPVLSVAVGMLIATGSRSAGLALIAGAMAMIMRQRRSRLRASLLVMSAIAGMVLVAPTLLAPAGITSSVNPGQVAILRLDNSRTSDWASSAAAIEGHPLTGLGAGAYPYETASSWLKLGTELGLMGLTYGLLVITMILRHIRRIPSSGLAGFTTAGLVSSLFEGWLFVGGSYYAVVFWAVLGSVAIASTRPQPVLATIAR